MGAKAKRMLRFARVNKVNSASLGYPLSVFNNDSTLICPRSILPYYCTPPVSVSAVLDALAVWRLQEKKFSVEKSCLPLKYLKIMLLPFFIALIPLHSPNLQSIAVCSTSDDPIFGHGQPTQTLKKQLCYSDLSHQNLIDNMRRHGFS